MTYDPRPIDTSEVEIPDELSQLTELLAKNAHDHWAIGRLRDGWRYGEKRHDEKKEHPDLVPYEDLPETEKQFDRETAMQTLRAIIALGFRIERR